MQDSRPIIRALLPLWRDRGTRDVLTQLVASSNRFGLELFQLLAKDGAGENILISPMAVTIALEMVLDGVMGSTERETRATLRIPELPNEDRWKASTAFLEDLKKGRDSVSMTVANSLWTAKIKNIESDFIRRIKCVYDGAVCDMSGAPENVNAWVSKQTNSKITNILSPSEVPISPSAMFLMNVASFTGAWFDPFRSI